MTQKDKRTTMKYSVDDSPKFKSKKSLAKWCKLQLTPDRMAMGVVFSDGVMSFYIQSETLLYSVLEAV